MPDTDPRKEVKQEKRKRNITEGTNCSPCQIVRSEIGIAKILESRVRKGSQMTNSCYEWVAEGKGTHVRAGWSTTKLRG
jgi:cytochrome c-type biogenesis protein CcmH/NrfF